MVRYKQWLYVSCSEIIVIIQVIFLERIIAFVAYHFCFDKLVKHYSYLANSYITILLV